MANVGMPRVSVVMPVFNAGQFLESSIASVLQQTMDDLELIVVDDGSTDASAEILARFSAEDRRVRVHRQANAGVAVALRVGCSLARSPLIARLDADDLALPRRLEQQVAFMDGHPSVVLLGTCVRLLGRNGPFRTLCRPADDESIRRALRTYNCVWHPTAMFRRDAYERVGGYRVDLPHVEDYDLWIRLGEVGQLANLPEPLVLYRVHPAQVSSSNLEHQLLNGFALRQRALDVLADERAVHRRVRRMHLWWAEVLIAAGYVAEGVRLATTLQPAGALKRGAFRLLLSAATRRTCGDGRPRKRLQVLYSLMERLAVSPTRDTTALSARNTVPVPSGR